MLHLQVLYFKKTQVVKENLKYATTIFKHSTAYTGPPDPLGFKRFNHQQVHKDALQPTRKANQATQP